MVEVSYSESEDYGSVVEGTTWAVPKRASAAVKMLRLTEKKRRVEEEEEDEEEEVSDSMMDMEDDKGKEEAVVESDVEIVEGSSEEQVVDDHDDYYDEPLKAETIYAWRFVPDSSQASQASQGGRKRSLHFAGVNSKREFYVSFQGMSHRHDRWMSQEELEESSPIKLRNFMARDSQPFESGDCPVPLEWCVVSRILDETDTHAFIVWGDLDYNFATWELKSEMEGDEEYKTQLKRFRARKQKTKLKRPARPDPSNAKKFVAFKAEDILPDVDLFPHQVDGINWLLFKWLEGLNVILADEMGLGKTCQSIGVVSLLRRLFGRNRVLVVAPLTTLANWKREVRRFAPDIDVISVQGSQHARSICQKYDLSTGRFEIVVTSYEVILGNLRLFSSITWDALIVDEGHRLKNRNSLFANAMSKVKTEWCVLLTGTPVQNTTEELTNLFYFLAVPGFSNPELVAQKYSEENLRNPQVLSELHDIIRPRMLRRVKEDIDLGVPEKVEIVVPVSLTSVQKEQYRHVLAKNYKLLARVGSKTKSQPLTQTFQQLRKVCQHPYLFPEAELVSPNLSRDDEYKRLINASAKLQMLDRMLKRLKEEGHRVLIFSQYVIMLDVLEDYLNYREYAFERIDGSVESGKRQAAIDRFNAPGSDRFCFLLSSRATRLGINLATADTVIIYDADFNPQNDLQALSRAHRMGQKNVVMVYTLICRHTIEERLLQLARSKLVLEHVVVEALEENLEAKQLSEMLKESSASLFSDENVDIAYDDAALEKMLDRSNAIASSSQKEAKTPNAMDSFQFARVWETNSNNANAVADKNAEDFWSNLLKKELTMLEEEELEKANAYGKGKRRRSSVLKNFKIDDSDEEGADEEYVLSGEEEEQLSEFDMGFGSSVGKEAEPFFSDFLVWMRRQHPKLSHAEVEKAFLSMSREDQCNPFGPTWTPRPVAVLPSEEAMSTLPIGERVKVNEAIEADKVRYAKELELGMPLSVSSYLANISTVAKSVKKPRPANPPPSSPNSFTSSVVMPITPSSTIPQNSSFVSKGNRPGKLIKYLEAFAPELLPFERLVTHRLGKNRKRFALNPDGSASWTPLRARTPFMLFRASTKKEFKRNHPGVKDSVLNNMLRSKFEALQRDEKAFWIDAATDDELRFNMERVLNMPLELYEVREQLIAEKQLNVPRHPDHLLMDHWKKQRETSREELRLHREKYKQEALQKQQEQIQRFQQHLQQQQQQLQLQQQQQQQQFQQQQQQHQQQQDVVQSSVSPKVVIDLVEDTRQHKPLSPLSDPQQVQHSPAPQKPASPKTAPKPPHGIVIDLTN